MKWGINNTKILRLHLRGIGWAQVWQKYCKDKHKGITVESPTAHGKHAEVVIYPIPFEI